ncbi:hypothetical protein [Komagataeibacter xylinus]|uniref:Uncharacterized protein n=1 Tax=Komagataeibacter xylinus TaxID=28448 RepID=A0A857FN69_KOMXY|nr:hypothetical protein [Komagataeibacter xylinus]QHC34697.1 hypothetical protein FMA36_03495 [Komagataeibacter xylinus]
MTSKISPTFQRILHWGGSGLALSGIIFVAIKLYSYWSKINISVVTPLSWCLICLLIVIYGTASHLLGLSWWYIIKYFDVPIKRLNAIRIYGLSQLAKYVPGNIFHLASRQIRGMAEGIPAGILTKSMIWEHGLQFITGSLFVCVISSYAFPSFTPFFGVILLISVSIAIIGFLWKFAGKHLAWAFFWQMIFLFISSSVFSLVLRIISGESNITIQQWIFIGGSYIIAWLIGMVTPGAPAGVGIREMILLFFLKGIVVEADLLMAVFLGRMVTVMGDLLFFVSAFLMPRPSSISLNK